MSTAQSTYTFMKDLKTLGLVIPDNATSFEIHCTSKDDPVVIMFVIQTLNSDYVTKEKVGIMVNDRQHLTVEGLFNRISYDAQLPENTESFKIYGDASGIVHLEIHSALPRDSFDNVKGCIFK